GELRTFRLDRAVDVEVLDEPRGTPPPDGELPRPRYVPRPDDHRVRLRLRADARWLVDAIEPEHLEEREGDVEVTFHTDALSWVSRLLLGAGAGVEVIEPHDLEEELRRSAVAALQNYEDLASEDSDSDGSDRPSSSS
ncbi:MAG: WYL domain-containing protein, partial [Nitriliruptorales bacterium]|nr:WYL domain-containing protein [Nitriliruptorales bacterium]